MFVFVPVPCCFDYCSFVYYCLKSGSVMPPVLSFFLSIALAILGIMWFYVNFRVICSSSVKNVMGVLIGIALNL